MSESFSLPLVAQRLYDFTTLCKPSENEIATIIDVVLKDLESNDSDLVRFVNSYPNKQEEKCLIRVLLCSWINGENKETKKHKS